MHTNVYSTLTDTATATAAVATVATSAEAATAAKAGTTAKARLSALGMYVQAPGVVHPLEKVHRGDKRHGVEGNYHRQSEKCPGPVLPPWKVPATDMGGEGGHSPSARDLGDTAHGREGRVEAEAGMCTLARGVALGRQSLLREEDAVVPAGDGCSSRSWRGAGHPQPTCVYTVTRRLVGFITTDPDPVDDRGPTSVSGCSTEPQVRKARGRTMVPEPMVILRRTKQPLSMQCGSRTQLSSRRTSSPISIRDGSPMNLVLMRTREPIFMPMARSHQLKMAVSSRSGPRICSEAFSRLRINHQRM